jgi:hypothetical protein
VLCCIVLCCAAACSVHVPHVYEAMSSPRVLVMEFIDGVQVTDKEGLQVGGGGHFVVEGLVVLLVIAIHLSYASRNCLTLAGTVLR